MDSMGVYYQKKKTEILFRQDSLSLNQWAWHFCHIFVAFFVDIDRYTVNASIIHSDRIIHLKKSFPLLHIKILSSFSLQLLADSF